MNRITEFFAMAILAAFPTYLMAQPQISVAQDPPKPQAQGAQQGPDAQRPPGERRMGLFGRLAAIHDQSIEISTPKGDTITVKITPDTQFRKEREAAKLTDFKVGDTVGVRGEENPDHTWTAQMIGALPSGGFGAGRGEGGPGSGRGFMQAGVLGQDFIFGEVKAIDAPKLTILRPDNVTQTLELTEATSLHKGRDSVTMADIQVGDHVFVRGGMKNNAFEPMAVQVIGPEQWKRMQEMGVADGLRANQPKQDNPQQQPPEPQR